MKAFKRLLLFAALCLLLGVLFWPAQNSEQIAVFALQDSCQGEFLPVSTPLTDLGAGEYIRMDGTPTGFNGGLYPDGANARPDVHDDAGFLRAAQIVPLDGDGNPDDAGTIGMISVGMSNTSHEYRAFSTAAAADPDVNPSLEVVNGASAGWTIPYWVEPDSFAWDHVDSRLAHHDLTPAQVQVAWVKLVATGQGSFPERPQQLQADLEKVTQNLLIRYPNIKLAYFASRTRAYIYWSGLSPEPAAFESGFGVKWLIEQQIEGDPELNFDPNQGPALAPWIAWSSYFWADGLNPRSDGLIWEQDDLIGDCVHPSASGIAKTVDMLLDFFKNDRTTQPWFLESGSLTPTPTPMGTPMPTPFPLQYQLYGPMVSWVQ